MSKKKAYDFIARNTVATLSTATNKGKPHAATVQFIIHKDLTICFSTRIEARKYKNIVANPNVAMAITHGDAMETIQLSGKAKIIENLGEEQKLLKELWGLRFNEATWPSPTLQMFEHGITNNIVVIKIKPNEMTFASFTTQPSGKFHPFFQKVI